MAGVSTQQIRNYADAGVLPPAERSPAGYRRFGPRHRDALLAYRALARGYGWDAARSVMHAVHAGDVPRALALLDERHAALHDQRLFLRATGEALRTVAEQPAGQPDQPDQPDQPGRPDQPAPGGLRIGEVAALLGVRPSALRVWEAAGLLAPERRPGTGYRRYGPADVRDARMVGMLRQGRHPLPQIKAVLDGLRRTGGTARLQAALAERQAALTAAARAMLEGSARLHGYLTALP